MAQHNGVDTYATGIATLIVNFWDGVADCRHCPFMYTDKLRDCGFCRLTDCYIDPVNFRKRMQNCPVNFKEVNNANSEKSNNE